MQICKLVGRVTHVGRISKSKTSRSGTVARRVLLVGREWVSGWVSATRWASKSGLETCILE